MDDLHHHHYLVPRSEGGGDDESKLITLCAECHFRLHERGRPLDHRDYEVMRGVRHVKPSQRA